MGVLGSSEGLWALAVTDIGAASKAVGADHACKGEMVIRDRQRRLLMCVRFHFGLLTTYAANPEYVNAPRSAEFYRFLSSLSLLQLWAFSAISRKFG